MKPFAGRGAADRAPATREPLLRALRAAALTMLAALATMGCALAIDPQPGPAVLGVVLCLSLSRSQLDRDLRGRIEAAIALPLVSLAALGAGLLLHSRPSLGAAAFVAAVSAAIWLRNFGARGRQIGQLIALPFVVLLVAAPLLGTRHVTAMTLLVPVVVGLLALFWVSLLDVVGRRLDWLAPAPASAERAPTAALAAALRPSASSRMALQMAAATATAFALGLLCFAEHWAWLVLTAYIVGSGNQGRGDVVYKAWQRVLGAAAGTLIALVADRIIGAQGASAWAGVLAAVFMAVWLRPLGYAWWALFITLALALLQGFDGGPSRSVLALRLQEIVLGAVIGVACAWFIWPVRSTDVLRRRIADALAALAAASEHAGPALRVGPFLQALAGVARLAPPFRAARLLARHWRAVPAADWVDTLLACREPAVALLEAGVLPGRVRKALAGARLALREPASLASALSVLRLSLAEATAPAALDAGIT